MQIDRPHALHILRRTDHDLIVIKPAGLPTEQPHGVNSDSLIAQIRNVVGPDIEPRLPHRLDKPARGIVLIALTDESIAFYNESIRQKQWGKYYIARVSNASCASLAHLVGSHRAYLRRKGKKAEIVRSGGQPSFLDILAASAAPARTGESHVLIQLHTGRYHQIRAMLANLGHPMVGDEMYGGVRGDMYLEHVALRFIDFKSGQAEWVHLPDDPKREAIDPSMRSTLADIISRA